MKQLVLRRLCFRYFNVDRRNSHWEQGGSTVYMLTEESQEMIFIKGKY